MLSKLLEEESPVMVYSELSCYCWEDETVRGRRAGRPFDAVALLHDHSQCVSQVSRQLRPGEHLFVFLGDVYALSAPECTRKINDELAEKLFNVAGIRLHNQKSRTWNKVGEIPQDMDQFGPEVSSLAGVKILGTIFGSVELVEAASQKRSDRERELWRAIPRVADLQCAWQLLVQCTGPRCQHFLCTIPHSQSGTCASSHDRRMQEGMATLLKGLPGRHGTPIGHVANEDGRTWTLVCAQEALPMIQARWLEIAHAVTEQVGGWLRSRRRLGRVAGYSSNFRQEWVHRATWLGQSAGWSTSSPRSSL